MSGSAWLLYLAVLIGIVLVDGWLGATAEYLNAYELLRQVLGLAWPARGEHYLLGQARLGALAPALATLAWLTEAAVVSLLLRWSVVVACVVVRVL